MLNAIVIIVSITSFSFIHEHRFIIFYYRALNLLALITSHWFSFRWFYACSSATIIGPLKYHQLHLTFTGTWKNIF